MSISDTRLSSALSTACSSHQVFVPVSLRDIIHDVNTLHLADRRSRYQSRRRLLARAFALPVLLATGCRAAAPRSPGLPLTLTMLAQQHPVAAVQGLLTQQSTASAHEVDVTLAVESFAPEDLRSKIDQSIASGRMPDLVIVGDADVAPLAARGTLLDVRDDLDRIAGLNGDLFPPVRTVAMSGPFVDRPTHQPAPVWAIPHVSIGGAWLIRKDLLSRRSLPLPKTFDDVRRTAETLTSQDAGTYGWGASLRVTDALDDLAHLALLAHGASLFDPLGLRIELDPGAAAAGLQAVANLYRRTDGSPLAPMDALDHSEQITTAFIAGNVAQTIDFGGLYARAITEQPSLRESIVALPPPVGPKGWFTSLPSTYLAISRRGRAPDQARALVARLLRPDRFDALVRAGRGSVIPPYAYLTKGPFWDEDPNYSTFFSNARGDPARGFTFAPIGYPAPPTLPAAVVQASHALASSLRAVALGETPASAAVAALEQALEQRVRDALALQPTPTATPPPFWVGLLGPTPTPR